MIDHRVLTFLTVCQELSFTKAAQRLHISQPAVSQHIQFIEEYYGVRVFHFMGKKIFLTNAGKLLRQSLTSLCNNEVYLKEQLLAAVDKRRTLRFGATLTVGEFLIAAPLSRFLSVHENADVSVTVANTQELLLQLDDGRIDFAILEGSYPKHSYCHMPFLTDNFIPICGENYRFRSGECSKGSSDSTIPDTPPSLQDLTAERLLVRESGSGTRQILEEALSECDMGIEDFPHTITIGNMNTIKDMVIQGCGITFLYETAVKNELTTGLIRRIKLPGWKVRHEISVVWKKDNLFADSLEETLRELFHSQIR